MVLQNALADLATEETLAAVRDLLEAGATESTLVAVRTLLQAGATEATLLEVQALLQNGATEATLLAIHTLLQAGTTVTVSNPTENPETGLAKDITLQARYGGSKLAFADEVAAAGDTTLITPAAGKRLRVYWVSVIPNPDNVAANLVRIKINTDTIYCTYAVAHWEIFEGAVDESVLINLENASPVAVTIHYVEVDA